MLPLLALTRILTDETQHLCVREFATVPAFLLMHSPSCGHCRAVLPLWEALAARYANESRVIVAQVDCGLHRGVCSRLAAQWGIPSFFVFKKGRGAEVRPERSLAAFAAIVEGLLRADLSVPCFRYPDEFEPAYPHFIFRSGDLPGAELCRHLQGIRRALPEAQDRLYYASPAPRTGYAAHLSEAVAVEYAGEYAYQHMVRFTKDYLMAPFGYWRVDDGPVSARRFVFVVHGGHDVVERFRPVAFDYIREFVVGGLRYEDFRAVEPNVTVQLPAVVVLNRESGRFAIVGGVATADQFGRLLERVLAGKAEARGTTRLPNLFPRLVDGAAGGGRQGRAAGWYAGWAGLLLVAVLIAVVLRRRRVPKQE
jgi:thiol-disulfide isomerase/thioredoxin